MYGYVLLDEAFLCLMKGRLDTFDPPTQESVSYKNWVTYIDGSACLECLSHHGKIYRIDEIPDISPPLHLYCRCKITNMRAVVAGNATRDGQNGADYWIKHYGTLPDYYITMDELSELGWRFGKPPVRFAPGKMPTMGIYENKNGHLPQIPGRIWYEADINYYNGQRNRHRLVWSNDGLIFVTYDHYETFFEII